MIQKFQQGGQQLQLDQIFAMLDQLPKETIKLLIQNGAKPQEIMQLILAGIKQGKVRPEIGLAVQLMFLNQVQAALHGAKLNYIKSLKHQCAEDEELVYYKKGGKVDCDCVKKASAGAELNDNKKSTPVLKFKKDLQKKKELKLDPKTTKTLPGENWSSLDRVTWEREHGDNDEGAAVSPPPKKKENGGSVVKTAKCGAVAKFKAEKCGGKMKKHFFGGKI